jgi:23S rRNA pseudouridine1911/1915/1917 synthase
MTESQIPPKPYTITTAAGQQPQRIDLYLQQALPSISRSKVHELIESGRVRIGGKIPRKSQKVAGGEIIEIEFRDQTVHDILAENIPLEIIFEDDYLLVVNKPAGMVTHPAHGNFSGTLVNALMHYLGSSYPPALAGGTKGGNAVAGGIKGGSGGSIRPGIVHRLDKGTSGLLVVAKDERTHRKLTDQFSERTVSREYRSIVWGRYKNNSGIIEAPLGRHPGDRKRFAVVKRGGKDAVTTYEVLESFADTSYLALRLKTGRTHQIRVHLEHTGHPVFGDADYGGRQKRLGNFGGGRQKFYIDLLETLPFFALHAQTLGFVHPVTSEALAFAIEPPDYFTNILKKLKKDAVALLDKK